VAEELHFTRAAERLAITPPSLTVQILLLEKQLEAPLFWRTNRHVSLTRVGEVLLPEARALLDQAARLSRQVQDAIRGAASGIVLGYVNSAVYSGVLQTSVARFRATRPGVELQLREAPMRDLPGFIEDSGVDIAFVRWPILLPGALASRIVLHDDFCLALPDAHLLAQDGAAVAPSALSRETLSCQSRRPGRWRWGDVAASRRAS
jgi:DNA-binding transcriptional LysR family regulator